VDDIDRWVGEKAAAALDVTAFSPTTGKSRQLASDELAEVLALLLEFDRAKASGADLAAFEERFAELGLRASMYEAATRRSRPLYTAKGGGVEHTGHHLKSLLETARDAARQALSLPRTPRLLPWDVKIFVVDDSDMAREVLGFMLRQLGFNVDLFTGAEELLRQIDNMLPELPHLILLDLMMPKVNGIEIARELQAGPKAEIPVVFVTGKKMDDSASKILRDEPNVKDFLTKPVTDKKLRAAVEAALAVRLD
jgi:CheY-like chemotaxis protein